MFTYMPRKPAPFIPGKYPLTPGATCLIGRYEFPYSAPGPDGKLMSFDVLMALELPDDKLLAVELVDPSDSIAVTEALRDVIRKPGIGKARRPERIRVATQRMADEVTNALGGGIPIEIASVAELDAAFAQLAASTAPEPELSYLNGDATPEQIGQLFEVMARFFEAAPWNAIGDSQVVRIDIPGMNVRGACMSIMGAGGASYGFLLFDSIEIYESFHRSSEAADRGEPADLAVDFFSVSFDSRESLPDSLLNEIETHKWKVAGSSAYPTILALLGGATRMSVASRDVRIAVAGLNAFLEIFHSSHSFFEDEESGSLLIARYDSNTEGEITISVPWASDEEIETWDGDTVN